MDKFIKIQSQQSEFSNNQNLVDFNIPASGVYELRDSWVRLVYNIDVVQDAAVTGAVSNMDLEWVTTDSEKPKFFNAAVVKNCSMSCANYGSLHNLRRNDIKTQSQMTFTKSQGEAFSEAYLQADQLLDPINRQKYGITRQFNKEGANKSQVNNNVAVQIPLSELFDIAHTDEYDTDKTGQTRIHLELNNDKLTAQQKMLNADIAPAEIKQFQDLNTEGEVNLITMGSGSDNYSITCLDDVPYYTGMAVKINGTGGGGAFPSGSAKAIISDIVWNRTASGNNSYQLRFESNWADALTAGQSITGITLEPQLPIASSSVSLVLAELVVKRRVNPQGYDQIEYHTYSTEETNGTGLQNFQELYPIEPEADAVWITFNDGADGLVSKNSAIESWRLRLDNQDLTNRDVTRDSPLANDRLAASLAVWDSDKGLRNLTRNAGDAHQQQNWGSVYTDSKFNTMCIAEPLPASDQTKYLQLNVNASAGGVNKLALFKQIPKRLVY